MLKLSIRNESGDEAALTLPFKGSQVGTEEVTLESQVDTFQPWRIRIILNTTGKPGTFTMSPDYANGGLVQFHEGLKFERAMSRGGSFAIEHAATGATLARSPLEAGHIPDPGDSLLVLLGALVTIQRKVGVLLTLPLRDIPSSEIRPIVLTSNIVTRGFYDITPEPGSQVFAELPRENVEALLQSLSLGTPPGFISLGTTETHDILGTSIEMGQVIVALSNYHVQPEHEAALRQALSETSAQSFNVLFTGGDNPVIQKIYPQWLSPEDRNALPEEVLE